MHAQASSTGVHWYTWRRSLTTGQFSTT